MAERNLPTRHRLGSTEIGLGEVVRNMQPRDTIAQPGTLRWPKLAVTAVDPVNGDYPLEAGNPNKYWIKFVDGDFDSANDGSQVVSYTNRQAAAKVICCNVGGAYAPLGTVFEVFRQANKFWTCYSAGGSRQMRLLRIETGGSSGGSAQRNGTPLWPDPVSNLWACALLEQDPASLAYTAGIAAWAEVIDLDPVVPSIVPLLAGDRFTGLSIGVHTDQFDFSRPIYAIRRERRDFRFEVTTAIPAGMSGAGRMLYWNGTKEVMIGEILPLIAGYDSFEAKVGDVVDAWYDPARGAYIAKIVECS